MSHLCSGFSQWGTKYIYAQHTPWPTNFIRHTAGIPLIIMEVWFVSIVIFQIRIPLRKDGTLFFFYTNVIEGTLRLCCREVYKRRTENGEVNSARTGRKSRGKCAFHWMETQGNKYKSPTFLWGFWKAVRTGLEPATPCVTGTYSNQLNYRTFASLWVHIVLWQCLSLSACANV